MDILNKINRRLSGILVGDPMNGRGIGTRPNPQAVTQDLIVRQGYRWSGKGGDQQLVPSQRPSSPVPMPGPRPRPAFSVPAVEGGVSLQPQVGPSPHPRHGNYMPVQGRQQMQGTVDWRKRSRNALQGTQQDDGRALMMNLQPAAPANIGIESFYKRPRQIRGNDFDRGFNKRRLPIYTI